MGRFVDRAATDVIALRNGDKVHVRQMLTDLEEKGLFGKFIRFELDMATNTVKQVPGDILLYQHELVKAYVTAWDFKDNEGNEISYKPSLVDDLDPATITELAEAIDKQRSVRREDSEKKAPKRSAK